LNHKCNPNYSDRNNASCVIVQLLTVTWQNSASNHNFILTIRFESESEFFFSYE
jgi:hypothetical protein